MLKILYKNILALYRYRDFHVGIFYFASPCIAADCHRGDNDINQRRLHTWNVRLAHSGDDVTLTLQLF